MAVSCRVVELVFIPLIVLIISSNAEENGQHDGVQDTALLRDLVYELRNTVKVQNSRFGLLEKRLLASERKINLLLSDKTRNEKVINELTKRLAKIESHDFPPQQSSEFKYRSNSSTEIHDELKKVEDEKTRSVRLLAPPTSTSAASPVAFYAYMSNTLLSPGGNQILKFDSVKTNVGNGYHHNTGVFIAPASGYYVFSWNVRIRLSVHSAELVVNNEVYGALYTENSPSGDGHGTGVAVAHVNTGDDIYVRIKSDKCASQGDVWSDYCGRSSFAGWKI